MRLCVLLWSLMLFAEPVLAACGETRDSSAVDRLSRAEAISRIDAICREGVAAIARIGPEPRLRSGSPAEVVRYARWSGRVGAVVEAGLRRIERVPIPDDARKGEVRAS